MLYGKRIGIINSLFKVKRLIKTHALLIVFNVFAINLAVSAWVYYDVRYFIRWYEEYFINGRLLLIYSAPPDLKVAYPPLAVMLFVLVHWIGVHISNDIVVVRLIDKLPILILFNLIYFILRKRFGKIASYLWLLNASVYAVISGYQFDLYNALFLLLSLLSIERGDYTKYGIFVTLSALTKHATGLVALIPVLELMKRRDWKTLLHYIKTVVVLSTIVILPFFILSPSGFIDKVLLFHARRPPQNLSIWAIPIYLTNYEIIDSLPRLYNSLWIIGYLVYMIFVIRLAWREQGLSRLEYYAKYQVLILLGLLILGKVGNATYLIWATPGLIVMIMEIFKRNNVIGRKIATMYVFTTFIAIVVFNIAGFLAPIVAQYPVFMFEDMAWMPTEILLRHSIGPYPFDIQYLIASFLRTIDWVREIFRAIYLTHGYIISLVIVTYIITLSYIAYKVAKYPNIL